MAIYRICRHDRGTDVDVTEFEAESDGEAFRKFEQSAKLVHYELWCGSRLVAKVAIEGCFLLSPPVG